MILGAEIGLLVYGIYTLITGKYSLGKGRFLEGGKARLLGGLCILPLPFAFGVGIILGVIFAIAGASIPMWMSTLLEIGILVVVIVLISVLGKKYYNEQESARLDAPTI